MKNLGYIIFLIAERKGFFTPNKASSFSRVCEHEVVLSTVHSNE